MRYSIQIIFIILALLACWSPRQALGQTRSDSAARARQQALEEARAARQHSMDSARAARQHILDSTKAARQLALDSTRQARQQALDSARAARERSLDSMRSARQHLLDSTQAVRERRTDSLNAIRKYRESKRFKDSVTRQRQARVDSVRAIQNARIDSMKAARKRISDSITAEREARTAALRARQQARADSLNAIRKYRNSKRFKDSVVVVKRMRSDSIAKARQARTDSMLAYRKHVADSMKAARQAVRDSLTADRKKYTDSIAAVRKAAADKVAKARSDREKLRKIREKEKEEKFNLALELKIKQKREAWSNEKMLKKKWNFPRRPIQNLFTRYNWYYNANRRMEEARLNMLRVRRDNYDTLLALFPFDPNQDSTLLAPDMDSIIRKTSVGIQIHDPRTKWGDDLYLLMGQAYYYKGNYEQAGNAFRYIVSMRQQQEKDRKKKQRNRQRSRSREQASIAAAEPKGMLRFLKHRTAHNQALLWLSRTFTTSGETDLAESVLDLLHNDPAFPEKLKGRLALEQAYLALQERNMPEAEARLAAVADDPEVEQWQRQRAAYLSGQLLQQRGRYQDAAARFAQVVDLKPKIDMDFYARKEMAYSLMYAGGDQSQAIASLQRMLRDGKYTPYYEQVYFVLGRLSANSNKPQQAARYLQQSIASSRSTRKQKALSFAALGNVYYTTGDYELAKLAYDSAALLASAVPGDSSVMLAVRRSRVLDQVARPIRSIRTTDSLLALAALDPQEQQSVVRRYIRNLERHRADSAFRASQAGIAAAMQDAGGDNAGMSWYFSNPTLMQQGITEFKRKWGTRPLTDNWRRASAGGFAANPAMSGGQQPASAEDGMELDASGLPTEPSLLAAIPNTPERRQEARSQLMQQYISLGNAYVRHLEDYGQAIGSLDTLDRRFAGHPHQAEALYLRYLVALRQSQLSKAQQYSQQLQQQFPQSSFAALIRPTEDQGLAADSLAGTNAGMMAFYEQTYNLLQGRQYSEVVQRSRMARNRYNDVAYQGRFQIVEAMAQAGSGNWIEADTLLSDFLRTNPNNDSLKAWAETVRAFVQKNKPVAPPPAPADSVRSVDSPPPTQPNQPTPPPVNPNQPTPPAAADTAGTAGSRAPAAYMYRPQDPHYFVFAFQRMSNHVMGLKSGLNDFNNLKFSSQGLNTQLSMLGAEDGLIYTSGFPSAAAARIYLNQFGATPQMVREFKRGEYQTFLISANNFQKLIQDKDLQAYLNFYRSRYK